MGGRAAGRTRRAAPVVDLEAHGRLVELVTSLVGGCVAGRGGGVGGLHDVSGGGLAVALAEMAVQSGVGCRVDAADGVRGLFGEHPSRVLVATSQPEEVLAAAAEAGVDAHQLGTAGGDRLVVGGLIDLPVAELRAAWRNRLPDLLDGDVPVTA